MSLYTFLYLVGHKQHSHIHLIKRCKAIIYSDHKIQSCNWLLYCHEALLPNAFFYPSLFVIESLMSTSVPCFAYQIHASCIFYMLLSYYPAFSDDDLQLRLGQRNITSFKASLTIMRERLPSFLSHLYIPTLIHSRHHLGKYDKQRADKT